MVHIQVKDVNEFAPTFKEPAYRAVVTEGKIYDSILQVEAVDEDCSPQYSQICNYEIVTTDVPFAIDRNGEWPERTPVGGGNTSAPSQKARWELCMSVAGGDSLAICDVGSVAQNSVPHQTGWPCIISNTDRSKVPPPKHLRNPLSEHDPYNSECHTSGY